MFLLMVAMAQTAMASPYIKCFTDDFNDNAIDSLAWYQVSGDAPFQETDQAMRIRGTYSGADPATAHLRLNRTLGNFYKMEFDVTGDGPSDTEPNPRIGGFSPRFIDPNNHIFVQGYTTQSAYVTKREGGSWVGSEIAVTANLGAWSTGRYNIWANETSYEVERGGNVVLAFTDTGGDFNPSRTALLFQPGGAEYGHDLSWDNFVLWTQALGCGLT